MDKLTYNYLMTEARSELMKSDNLDKLVRLGELRKAAFINTQKIQRRNSNCNGKRALDKECMTNAIADLMRRGIW